MKILRNISPMVRRLATMRRSSAFHNALTFLGFVVVAAIFWVVMAMNDSFQGDFMVKVAVVNVPDSITFIQEPPQAIHVAVRDRGTSLLRVGGFREPVLNLNFRDYAKNGYFRVSPADLTASLKGTFGKSASILAVSEDSLRLSYTTSKGKLIPILVSSELSAAPGSVLVGKPAVTPPRVRAFGSSAALDTLTRVMTEKVVMRNLVEPRSIAVELKPIHGVRFIPDKVVVEVKVEPLVRKETEVAIKAINVPEGISLMLFPARVKVGYYVPMSKFNEEVRDISVIVDYNSVRSSHSLKLPIYLGNLPSGLQSPALTVDSVEYSVVR